MKIAVLGGAFNPPHLGHLLIAKQILELTAYQEVWLMPCFRHTFQKSLVASRHRLKMVKLIAANSKMKTSDFEIKNKLPGNTLETMTLLTKKFPDTQLAFILGSDNLPTFKKWGHWRQLATDFRLLIFPRPGFNYNLKKYGLDHPAYLFKLIKHPLLATSNISSTLIRKRLEAGLSIDYLLPEKVREYIKKNRLYR